MRDQQVFALIRQARDAANAIRSRLDWKSPTDNLYHFDSDLSMISMSFERQLTALGRLEAVDEAKVVELRAELRAIRAEVHATMTRRF